MNLELKHLAPYFANKLHLLDDSNTHCILTTLHLDCVDVEYSYNVGSYEMPFKGIKPILRPLSQLTETIEHNGEKFVPMVELAKVQYPVSFEIIENECVGRLSIGVVLEFFIQDEIPFYKEFHNNIFGQTKDNDFDDMTLANITPSEIRGKLLEWHFDVFGLIENNLAIAVTDELNPYK
jgi:hypothetical protein